MILLLYCGVLTCGYHVRSLRCLQQWYELGGGNNSANSNRLKTQWRALDLTSTERRFSAWHQSHVHLPTQSSIYGHRTAKSSSRVRIVRQRRREINNEYCVIVLICLHDRCLSDVYVKDTRAAHWPLNVTAVIWFCCFRCVKLGGNLRKLILSKGSPSSESLRYIPVSYTHLTLPTNREV